MTTKYIAVDYNENAGANPEVFDSLKEANACIENKWNHLTDSEKEHSHYYAAKVTEEDLVEDGDWTSFEDYEDGLAYFDSDKINSIYVQFLAGESVYDSTKGVDYLIADYETDDGETDRLYAEMENPTWDEEKGYCEDDEATLEDLKEEILEQAEEKHIHPSRIEFWGD